MITITMPIWFAVVLTISLVLDTIAKTLQVIVDARKDRKRKLEIELEKIVRGIK